MLKLLCDKSRMMGDYHVRFCERFGGEIPPYLLDYAIDHVSWDCGVVTLGFFMVNYLL